MKFEYKTIPVEGGALKNEALNNLGEEGWRLVTITPRTEPDRIVYEHVFIREKRSR